MNLATKKHWILALLFSAALLILAGGCATSGPAATAPTAIPAAANAAAPTSAPDCAIKCSVVKKTPKQTLEVNYYSITGQSVAEIEGLQVDVTCENGQASLKGDRVTEASGLNLAVKLNEERTYSDSNNVYKIEGSLSYAISNMEKLASYTLTVSGGKLAAPQTCNSPK